MAGLYACRPRGAVHGTPDSSYTCVQQFCPRDERRDRKRTHQTRLMRSDFLGAVFDLRAGRSRLTGGDSKITAAVHQQTEPDYSSKVEKNGNSAFATTP